MSTLRRIWQRMFISLARSSRSRQFMEELAGTSRLARRFVGGSDVAEVIETGRPIREEGILASLYFLGEYEADPAVVGHNVEQICAACEAMAAAGLDVHVSVDPTQIGYLISLTHMRENADLILDAVRRAGRERSDGVLMLDMEDYGTIDATLALHRHLLQSHPRSGVTLQACLKRTRDDLHRLIDRRCVVRLVKGAFAPGADVAYTRRGDVRRVYAELSDVMLEDSSRDGHLFPVFATHDETLISHVIRSATASGWAMEDYEFEMLHGVRPDLQRRLAAEGYRVRAYIPFGRHWWPYAARRVGESPRNARLILRALLGGGDPGGPPASRPRTRG